LSCFFLEIIDPRRSLESSESLWDGDLHDDSSLWGKVAFQYSNVAIGIHWTTKRADHFIVEDRSRSRKL
jgi:hypothetical protein